MADCRSKQSVACRESRVPVRPRLRRGVTPWLDQQHQPIRPRSSRASARSCARPAAISSSSSTSSCSASMPPPSARHSSPSSDETAALLNTFGVFWLGALMRPVGAIVLGAYIDRIGRRQGLIVTLGDHGARHRGDRVLPDLRSIGIAAPVIVLIGRLLQGFSAGVELGGVSVYLSEISTPGNRGFYTSFQSSSQQVAIFVASILGYILSEMMPADTSGRLGLAHSVLCRLPDHPPDLLAAADARGNAGLPGHEETSDRKRGVRLRARQLAHRHSRHDDRGPDHDDVLLRHGVYADLRQDRAQAVDARMHCW